MGASGRYVGVYIGMVVNAADPLRSGRAQVQIPSLGIQSIWGPVCTPSGTSTSTVPVGARVVVAFEAGDPDHPVILGRIP